MIKRGWSGPFGDARILCLFLIHALCPLPSACFCFDTPLCSSISGLSESSVAFVGQVIDVWPSRETAVSEMRGGASEPRTLSELKQTILKRWQRKLTADEEAFIRTTQDRDALNGRFGARQRVRFIVRERLQGPQIREVDTDLSSCGYRFQPGITYLVIGHAKDSRYSTGACSSTSEVDSESAIEDLKPLRARQRGNSLPPRIYGKIDLRDVRPDTRVRLLNEQNQVQRTAVPEANGRFSFDGLAKSKYRLEVSDSRGRGERLLDLNSLGCFEASPWFSDVWRVAGSPVLLEIVKPKPIPLILESPPILPPPPLPVISPPLLACVLIHQRSTYADGGLLARRGEMFVLNEIAGFDFGK